MTMKVGQLKGYYKNPRRGNLAIIQDSVEAFGVYRSVVVNEGTKTGRPYEVLVGNHTVQAARAAGVTEVPVHLIDVDEDTAARIVLADNRTSDSGGYDDESLLSLLEGLDDIAHTGYTDDDVEDLLVGLEAPPLSVDVDEDSMERFAATSMRAMYVEFQGEEFIRAQETLQRIASERGLTSNAAVVATLAREARGEQ